MRRHYLDYALGQLHYRRAEPAAGLPRRRPVVCLHQTPTSSLEFEPLMRELAGDRVVVALDTPGYGGSDGPSQPQSIEFYAARCSVEELKAMTEFLKAPAGQKFVSLAPEASQIIAPRFIRIHADWYVRGGIRTYVTVEHRKKGWKPQPPVDLAGIA